MNSHQAAEPIAFTQQPQNLYQITRDGKKVKTVDFRLGDVIQTKDEEMSIHYYGESTIIMLKKNTKVVLKIMKGLSVFICRKEVSFAMSINNLPINLWSSIQTMLKQPS